MLVFHPALAPYRIDQFNALNEIFDLHLVFLFDNLWTFKYDQSFLLSQCKFKYSFLIRGPRHKGRFFRFGMFKKIKSINPDIVIGHEFSFTTQYLILLKRIGFLKQKVGSMIDDSLDICHNIQSGIRFIARGYSIKYLDFIVLLSQEVSSFYQKELNFKKENIIISPILQSSTRLRNNSKNIEFIAHKYAKKYNLNNKKVLLFVGRLITEKALPLFLSTVHSHLLENKKLIFIIVGDGDEKKGLELIIEQHKLQDKVILVGRYDNDELYAWYLCASGFVLTSLSETFGAVVNEALIFGLPVLCSKYAGASSLITSENGIVFDPLDKGNTIENLKIFLSTMKSLSSIDLNLKPSLMKEKKFNFNKEWSKLIN